MTRRARATAGALVAWWLYTVNAMILALGISWGLYSLWDYGYPLWYEALDIEAHIQEYGPQNRYRQDFAVLDEAQYQDLFQQIRKAVHASGEGLKEIRYPDRQGRPTPLLHEAEILHLQDVARLINRGTVVVLICACLWWPLALWVRRPLPGDHVGKEGPPGYLGRTVTLMAPLMALGIWLLIAGPEAVFYQFHIWLFPPEHEWFFYWQDSLMSTLMKAPVLFGGIAVVLALGTLVMTPLVYFAGLVLARRGAVEA